MRWLLMLASVLFISTTVATAGEHLMEISARVSGNHAFATSLPNDYESTSGLGWSLGVGSQIGLGNLIALSPELFYEQRTFDVSHNDSTNTVNMGTVCLPVMLRIGLPLGFMFEVGAEYVQFVSKSADVSTDGEGLAVIGFLWRAPFGLSIGARYHRGVTEISTPLDDDVQTNMTSLYLTYSLFEIL